MIGDIRIGHIRIGHHGPLGVLTIARRARFDAPDVERSGVE
jgi:hypothetical protein